ncbi:unnamed protein product [Diatraea saccharalis]|uniref:FP protein C-terminal domain-containing protein n=1 Tax=Diatraea saccharalis TaxID=40085 RepID=A0A9N9R1X2_9NEOP|nr:unnamed protein product [Diatraea saccharalis]
MPLRRTPPREPVAASDCDSLGLSDTNDAELTAKVPHRQKRKRTNTTDSQLNNFMVEMKSLFTEFKVQQEDKLNKICTVVEEVKVQNSEIRSSIEFLSKQYDFILNQVNVLKEQVHNSNKKVELLENKLEKYERSSRSTCLEIRNIPVKKSETKVSLLNTVIEIGDVLSLTIQPLEIKDIFRVNTKNPENKTIIMELNNVITKEKFLNAFKSYNKSNNRLCTGQLKISGPPKPIFISENLTTTMKRLFYLARVFASSNNYNYCWTTNGKIFIRKKEGYPLHWIKSEYDLQKLNKQED